jgi:hypothetical protein
MDDREWHEPWRYTVFGRDGHKSCWDCRHVRVARYTDHPLDRRCSMFPGKPLPPGNAANLSMEPDGVTVADKCDGYEASEQTKTHEFMTEPVVETMASVDKFCEEKKVMEAFR